MMTPNWLGNSIVRRSLGFAGSLSLCVVLGVLIGGCNPPPLPSPPVSDALYNPTKNLLYNSNAQQYSTHFDGVLSYNYGGACQNVPFSFTDHPKQPAQLIVSIVDTAGLQPGDHFVYNLVFTSPSGDTLETFTLPIANPIGSPTPRMNSFPPFVIQLNSATSGLNWNVSGQPVVGTYSIVSGRDMSVSLQFNLRQTVNGASGPACSPAT